MTLHPSGLLLPRHEERTVLRVRGADAEHPMANSGNQTLAYRRLSVARSRIRYGTSKVVHTRFALNQSESFNPISAAFRRDADAWNADYVVGSVRWADLDRSYRSSRLPYFWTDTWNEPYWDAVPTDASISGNMAATTFLMPRSGWITNIPVVFSRRDSSGSVTMLLTEVTENGEPDPLQVLAVVTVAAADLKAAPDETRFPVGPIYGIGGRRYGVILVTAGNHWLAMAEGNRYGQGTAFVYSGSFLPIESGLDMNFAIIGAGFNTNRVVVPLGSWSLSGGIADIDLDLEQVVPRGCSVSYQVQIGSAWKDLSFVLSGAHPLTALPVSVNARAVLVGTSDLMPGIMLARSFRTLARPKTSFVYISKPHILPGNSDEVQVRTQMDGWDGGVHAVTVKLLVAPSYGTVVNASATTISNEEYGGQPIKRSSFVLSPTVDRYRVRIEGTAGSAAKTFVVSGNRDVAYPA